MTTQPTLLNNISAFMLIGKPLDYTYQMSDAVVAPDCSMTSGATGVESY